MDDLEKTLNSLSLGLSHEDSATGETIECSREVDVQARHQSADHLSEDKDDDEYHEDDGEANDEDDDEEDTTPLNDFERSNWWLLRMFRRDAAMFRGPQASITPVLPKPEHLRIWRVTDDTTFVKYDPKLGFVNEAPGLVGIPAWCFLDAQAVTDHMNLLARNQTTLARFVSLCGSAEIRDIQLKWRINKGRQNICVHRVDVSRMQWGRIDLRVVASGPSFWVPSPTSASCLFQRRECTVLEPGCGQQYLTRNIIDIVFVKAMELIDFYGVKDQVGEATYERSNDEWLAVSRVPVEMISLVNGAWD